MGGMGHMGGMGTAEPVQSATAFGDASFLSAHFVGSGRCAMCHDGLRGGTGADVSIRQDWGSAVAFAIASPTARISARRRRLRAATRSTRPDGCLVRTRIHSRCQCSA